jgi:hypothetical protein
MTQGSQSGSKRGGSVRGDAGPPAPAGVYLCESVRASESERARVCLANTQSRTCKLHTERVPAHVKVRDLVGVCFQWMRAESVSDL